MLGGPPRLWDDARAKVDEEGVCRNCKRSQYEVPLEAAHVSGREFDEYAPCDACEGSGFRRPTITCGVCKGSGHTKKRYVNPDDVIPLCGPTSNPSSCHAKQHAHEIELLGLLKPHEEARAVIHFGGLENARTHLAPSAYRSAA